MPGFNVHSRIGKLCAGGIALSTFIVLNSSRRIAPELFVVNHAAPTALALGLGTWFGGTLGSPDLDIPSSPYNHWGELRYVWLPYQILVKHRSPLSHWPIVGTVVRVTYLIFILVSSVAITLTVANLLLFAVGLSYKIPIARWTLYAGATILKILKLKWFWLFIIGDVIGGAIHDITDYLDGKRRSHYRGHPVPPLSDERPDTPNIW